MSPFWRRKKNIFDKEEYDPVFMLACTANDGIKYNNENELFIDFDEIYQNPENKKRIQEDITSEIGIIRHERGEPNFLGFLKRYKAVSVGTIQITDRLSELVNIPYIIIQEIEDNIYNVKITPCFYKDKDKNKKLEKTTTILISDHSSTGEELKGGIKAINSLGGSVKDIILYSSFLEDGTYKEFEDLGVKIRPLITKERLEFVATFDDEKYPNDNLKRYFNDYEEVVEDKKLK